MSTTENIEYSINGSNRPAWIPTPPRRKRNKAAIFLGVAVGVLVVGQTAAVIVAYGQHNEVVDTHAELRGTQATLTDTKADLGQSKDDLESTKTTLSSTQASLANDESRLESCGYVSQFASIAAQQAIDALAAGSAWINNDYATGGDRLDDVQAGTDQETDLLNESGYDDLTSLQAVCEGSGGSNS